MTQLSRTQGANTLPRKLISQEEKAHRQQLRSELATRCRVVFERVRPLEIEAHYNWYIAIDPDTEQYIIDPTFDGIVSKIVETYGYSNKPKLTIFKLNETGYCGRI